jgi:hypothetical protein
MTATATRTYLVGVIERALAYYEVEAEDARTAAENWQDGEFHDRDDEALDTEGACSVRERQPDGSWKKVPPSQWEDGPTIHNVSKLHYAIRHCDGTEEDLYWEVSGVGRPFEDALNELLNFYATIESERVVFVETIKKS